MKIRNYLFGAVVAASTMAVADDYIVVYLTNGETRKIEVDTSKDSVRIAANSFCIAGKEFGFDSVDHMSFLYEESPAVTEPSDDERTVYVTWNGTDTPIVRCSSTDVTVATDGANVTLTNSNVTDEYTYVLDGASADGSFTLISGYKSTVMLNGLSLKSSQGAAANIQCGKRVALELAEGTVNTLEDATDDCGQKAALYCKGHLEISGGGTLNLTGNVKHALSSKEYCLVKKTAGTVNIVKAESDGIHAGQYFKMNGGNIVVKNVGGDGIQAEASLEVDYDEELTDGSMLIRGGSIDIATTGEDVSALKSDAEMVIEDGDIKVSMTGALSKALNTDTDLTVSGGCIEISNSGTGLVVDNENETSKGLNADHDIRLLSGKISISMTGAGGKGMKADNDIYVGNSETGTGPTLYVKTSGSEFGTSSTGSSFPGGGGRPWPGGPGGAGGESSGGSAAKAMKCEGCYYQYGGSIYVETTGSGAEGIESKSSQASSMTFAGGNLLMKVYDDCINSAGQINFCGANVICISTGNDALDSNYGKTASILQTDGVVISFSQKGGAEMGIDADAVNRVTVTGGTLITGGGSQGGSSSSLGTGSTHYKVWSGSVSYTANNYYSIVCGENIITWLMPATLTSSFNIFASSHFKSSTTHYLYSGSTVPTDAQSVHSFVSSASGESVPMVWIKSNVTSGTQRATFSPN